jgi:hypothetical protein
MIFLIIEEWDSGIQYSDWTVFFDWLILKKLLEAVYGDLGSLTSGVKTSYNMPLFCSSVLCYILCIWDQYPDRDINKVY